jgi:hypothetical protein
LFWDISELFRKNKSLFKLNYRCWRKSMTTYIEYDLGKGGTLLVEAADSEVGGVVRASRGPGEFVKVKAKMNFEDALKDIKMQAKLLMKEIEELQVAEAEIKFGINVVGEVGNMAIGKLGAGINYEVTLKWKKPEEKPQ